MATKNTERAIIIGGRLRQAITDAGLNNSELARRTGVQRRTIVRIANGHNEPDSGTLEKLAKAVGKSLDYFSVSGPALASPRVVEAVNDLYQALLDDLREEIGSPARPKVGAL